MAFDNTVKANESFLLTFYIRSPLAIKRAEAPCWNTPASLHYKYQKLAALITSWILLYLGKQLMEKGE